MTIDSQIPFTLENVFITDGFPRYTYVDPADGRPEKDLKDGLQQANKIISIVGASKCGKTTLCDKFFGTTEGADLIQITGDQIDEDANQLWSLAWDQLEESFDNEEPNPKDVLLTLIQREIPIVIDDFHYIPIDIQKSLCRKMKSAASRGLRFVILNTPHRGDDPIRNNADLSGRYFSVDMGFWSISNLKKIGKKGFDKLEVKIHDEALHQLASEALGSPQLMQTLCLETGRYCLDLDTPYENQWINQIDINLREIRERSVRSYNLSTQLEYLRNGPSERGKKRNTYDFTDGTSGDVYDALIKGIGSEPPFSSILVEDLKARIDNLCTGTEKPNVKMALGKVNDLFKDGSPPIEWIPNKRALSITDPHFYFYLRCVAMEPNKE